MSAVMWVPHREAVDDYVQAGEVDGGPFGARPPIPPTHYDHPGMVLVPRDENYEVPGIERSPGLPFA